MQTIDQALTLLWHFNAGRPELSLTDLALSSGFDKAKTRRYLMALLKHGYVEQSSRGRNYKIGYGATRIARIQESVASLGHARQSIKKLCEASKYIAHMSMLTGEKMSVLELEEFKRSKTAPVKSGMILPLHASAAGLVVLSYARFEYQEKILANPLAKLTKYTILEKPKLRALFRRIAADGYVHTSRGFDERTECIASPLFNGFGLPSGAVSISFPVGAVSKAQAKILSRKVVQTAVDITKKMDGMVQDIQSDYLRTGSSRS
ncbi:MAG: IclR family transcriptional regulator [Gammaproteobacteria bacterium]|nr:IclR family transcriptional regulator [Pseudomonadota bacterium]MCH9662973.1 IclR family transcriptional regulator [Gammaproteobacteria bacterium]